MNDLIKRDDALECIDDAQDGSKKTYDILADVFNRVSGLPSADRPTGWIPVSERLPSESGWYLITIQGCEKVADMEWYYGEWDAWNGVSSEQQVLAWMPLPEPYKGGEDK